MWRGKPLMRATRGAIRHTNRSAVRDLPDDGLGSAAGCVFEEGAPVGREERIRRGRFRGHPCIYCAVEPGTSLDHVPPRNLFPKPRPANLPAVPCCERCRRTQLLDDEFLPQHGGDAAGRRRPS